MKRVVITRSMVGACGMQVCADQDASDEEILHICNRMNPSGTTNGWMSVIRGEDPPQLKPTECAQYPGRKHFLVVC